MRRTFSTANDIFDFLQMKSAKIERTSRETKKNQGI
jgi:hypothetical protein